MKYEGCGPSPLARHARVPLLVKSDILGSTITPRGLLAGEANCHWDHASAVARQLLQVIARFRRSMPIGEFPTWRRRS